VRSSTSDSRPPPGTGTSSTWFGCSCSCRSTSGVRGRRRSIETPQRLALEAPRCRRRSRAISSWRRAHLVVPTLCVVVALALLVALGNWQLERRAWKQGLLDAIAARTAAQPTPLEEALAAARAGADIEYLRVAVRGRFDHAAERHVYALDDAGQPGFHVYTPLTTPERRVVLVNRGFVPFAQRDPSTRQAGQIGASALV